MRLMKKKKDKGKVDKENKHKLKNEYSPSVIKTWFRKKNKIAKQKSKHRDLTEIDHINYEYKKIGSIIKK